MKTIGMIALCVGVVAGCTCSYRPENGEVAVASPDGRNEIRLKADGGALTYEVLRDGVVLAAKAKINMKVNGKELFDAGAAEKMLVTCKDVSGCQKMPVYKKDSICLGAKSAFVGFGDWGVRLVARNDGVAYRFETDFDGDIIVDTETMNLAIPGKDVVCWANPFSGFGREESVPGRHLAKDLPGKFVYLPFVYAAGGKTVAFTESNVRDYPILDLQCAKDAVGDAVTLEQMFAPRPTKTERHDRWVAVKEAAKDIAKVDGEHAFPWRTFILVDEAAKLCEADIVAALADPADPDEDFSWVKPGKVAWDWWNCFDNGAGCNTKTYERFIDFAAKNGVEYVIFDEGWSEHLNIWKFHPDVDVPHLIDYANKKGVGIILWMAWSFVNGDEERVAEHFAKLGAKGFKVDFMDRGDAAIATFLEKFAKACAKHKMLVDYHGVYRPTGLQREYPNVLNYEGINGLEQMKWFGKYDMMANDVRASFLRMTAGPMDYTPGAMDNYVIGQYKGNYVNPGSEGTRCHQMAMMAAYEAPLQMLSDSPTKYEKNMECFSFMAKVPTVWAKTIGLGGDPDSFFAVARQAKDGTWYAAALGNASTHDFTVDTSFLGEGTWKAEIFRDAADADKEPTHYVHETKTVKAGDKLAFHMAPGGGFIVNFTK